MCGGHGILCPPSEKVGGHVSRVPHQIAPMVHHNTSLNTFWTRIVWFQPKQDSDRIGITFFKNRIGSDSKKPLCQGWPTFWFHAPIFFTLISDAPQTLLPYNPLKCVVLWTYFEVIITCFYLKNICLILYNKHIKKQGRTQGGGLGLTSPPWAWYFTKAYLPAQRRLTVFAYFLLVNLSTYCKYHRINLHANFKEHCKRAKK